jgi:cell division protein FtsQ
MRPVSRLSQRLRGAIRRDREWPWRRRARRAGLALLALLLVAGGGLWAERSGERARLAAAAGRGVQAAGRSLGLVVREVTAEGRVRTAPRELLEVLESRVGAPILSVELEDLRKQLEGLPWVKSAAVRRHLPGTLHAVIEEHRPLALWRERDGARTRLIDEEGEIVPVADLRPFMRFTLLTGKGAPQAAKELFALLAAEPGLARRTTVASRVGGRRWNLYLDGRIEVRLPAEGAQEALRRLAAEDRASGLLARAVEAVDLRSADWIVVRVVEPPARKPATGGGRGA